MNSQFKRALGIGSTGLAAVLLLTACDTDPEIGTTGVEAPQAARAGNVATANLEPVGGSGVTGTVTFAQLEDALQVDAAVMGITQGEHGFHLHENGDCSAPDASSAGGHFSPDDNPHGAPTDPAGQHHAGDLGNLTAAANGKAEVTQEDRELTLVGEYGVVGKAVIVHSRADDLQSQPSGDAGDRIACGVIEWGTSAVRGG